MAIQERLYTVEEFEAFIAEAENIDRLFELIDGEIIEKCLPKSITSSSAISN